MYISFGQNYFVLGEGGGGTYLKAGANSNVYRRVFQLMKKRPFSLSSVKFSCLISYYICTLFLSLFVKWIRFTHPSPEQRIYSTKQQQQQH